MKCLAVIFTSTKHRMPKNCAEETVPVNCLACICDCARANKAMSAWGVEARVPFLDKKFLDVAMRINPQDKMCSNGKMEKHGLRECFESYLPGVAWRQKEQFSDGRRLQLDRHPERSGGAAGF